MPKKEDTHPYKKYKGKDYYYVDSSKNLYFKSFRSGKYELIKDVDLGSLKLMTNFYSCDKERVYHESKCLKREGIRL
jgi:hypothetical protein